MTDRLLTLWAATVVTMAIHTAAWLAGYLTEGTTLFILTWGVPMAFALATTAQLVAEYESSL